jgi:hypothetical protein
MYIRGNFQSTAQLSGSVKIFCSEQLQVRSTAKKNFIRGNVAGSSKSKKNINLSSDS